MSNKKQLQDNNEVLAAVRETLSKSLTMPELMALLKTKAPMYGMGTADLVAGETPLEAGKLYFMYEVKE